MTQPLAFQTVLSIPYDKAVERVTAALKSEGFGVLTSIDVKSTLKQKLDADFRPYVILGACNPALAQRALSSEPRVGMLLPCNITIEDSLEGTLVSIVNPQAMLEIGPLAENDVVCEVAAEARTRLERVAKSLE